MYGYTGAVAVSGIRNPWTWLSEVPQVVGPVKIGNFKSRVGESIFQQRTRQSTHPGPRLFSCRHQVVACFFLRDHYFVNFVIVNCSVENQIFGREPSKLLKQIKMVHRVIEETQAQNGVELSRFEPPNFLVNITHHKTVSIFGNTI